MHHVGKSKTYGNHRYQVREENCRTDKVFGLDLAGQEHCDEECEYDLQDTGTESIDQRMYDRGTHGML